MLAIDETPAASSRVTEEDPVALAASDFGGIVHHRPREVVAVTHVDDVVRAVRRARAEGLAIAARGQGHSTRGQAQVSGGLIVDMRGLADLRVEGRSVVAGAGARWDQVLAVTLPHGLTPPTLTDYLGLSVGGTLAVGGVGGQSFHHGVQADNVEELTVVTGRAELVTCSPRSRPDLFNLCRAGMGQCGLIVEARLRLAPAPSHVRVWHLPCPDLASFLDQQRGLADAQRFDYLLGSIRWGQAHGWCFSIEAAEYLNPGDGPVGDGSANGLSRPKEVNGGQLFSYPAYAGRLAAMEAAMKEAGTWDAYHPWMDLLLPARAAQGVIATALDALDPHQLADGHLMTYPLVRSAASTTTLFAFPDDTHAFLFDVLPNLRMGDRAGLAAFETICARIVETAWQSGGRVYPIGFPIGTPLMTPPRWRQQVGRHWQALAAAKRAYDPDHILTPGMGMTRAVSPARGS